MFTERECNDVKCEACRVVNRRQTRVPRVADAQRTNVGPGEVAYQDLTQMPTGVGNYKYVSVIVDAHTRKVAAMALRSKDEALAHSVAYVRRLERAKQRVKCWKSDNGGEFINEEFSRFLISVESTRETNPG